MTEVTAYPAQEALEPLTDSSQMVHRLVETAEHLGIADEQFASAIASAKRRENSVVGPGHVAPVERGRIAYASLRLQRVAAEASHVGVPRPATAAS